VEGIAQLPESMPLDEADDEVNRITGREFGSELLT
jgi:hypothetical protein